MKTCDVFYLLQLTVTIYNYVSIKISMLENTMQHSFIELHDSLVSCIHITRLQHLLL